MFECSVAFMARCALPRISVAEIDRMLKNISRRYKGFAAEGLVYGGMTDRAVVANHSSFGAYVLSVMTPKAARSVVVTYVVDMGLPVGLHLREEIGLVKSL
jgi:hypothetical protein